MQVVAVLRLRHALFNDAFRRVQRAVERGVDDLALIYGKTAGDPVGHVAFGTNSRPGEDTNNSWYWSLQSEAHASEIAAYIAIIKTLFDTIYLAAESGDRLLTESGDNILIDF